MSNSAADETPPVVSERPTSGGLEIPKPTLKALDFATQQEFDQVSESVGYSARVWAQVSLPYRDPGDAPYWERRNGAVSLTMRPALLQRPDGTRYEAYPFGVLPRHALTYIASEAVRTQDPTINLGTSMSSFMSKIGLARGGADARRLTDQLRRLFGSNLSVQGLMANGKGYGEVTKYFQIADQVQLWFTSADEKDGDALWSSEVVLSDAYFRSIVDAPIPVHLGALQALGSAPMRLDIYLWATYKMFGMRSVTRIKWEDLSHQFGSQYRHVRQFKARFAENLAVVKTVYPELNAEVHDDFLLLRPSPPHVKPTKRRLELV